MACRGFGPQAPNPTVKFETKNRLLANSRINSRRRRRRLYFSRGRSSFQCRSGVHQQLRDDGRGRGHGHDLRGSTRGRVGGVLEVYREYVDQLGLIAFGSNLSNVEVVRHASAESRSGSRSSRGIRSWRIERIFGQKGARTRINLCRR